MIFGLAIVVGLFCIAGLYQWSHPNAVPGPMSVRDSNWTVHSGEFNSTRYSPLGQITPENVKSLEVAWTYSSGEMKRRTPNQIALAKDGNIPIKVGNRLLICTPFNRIASIDPVTGKEQWVFDPHVDLDLGPRDSIACRGVSYWHDPDATANTVCAERVVSTTTDHRLLELDLQSGRLCPTFGKNGVEEIVLDKPLEHKTELTFFMPPVVTQGVIVLGSSIEDDVRTDAPSGKLRAYDVKSGAPRWEWDAVPRSAEDPAYKTWANDSSLKHGSANTWGFITADPKKDVIYVPTTSPSADAYGGERPGDNRNTESVVALQASTGKFLWAYQLVHHDLWDYDVAPQPLLADIPVGGKVVPAIIQNSKQGLIFVLNRETGQPIFPVDETPVPKGDVPGEWYSPTQPIPRFPAPLRPETVSEDDAWGVTPWDKAECKALIHKYRHGPLYTPASLQGTIVPWWGGGVEWPGPAYDPTNHVMYVNSNRIFGVYRLVDSKTVVRKRGIFGAFPMAGTPYALVKNNLVSKSGVPCSPPPWSGLTAVDMSTGKKLWDVPLGSIERFVPLKPRINMDWWGVPGVGAPIVTAGGVIFIAGTIDQRLRAFSAKNGEELWNTVMPADAQTTPMTYAANGRQYVVISAGGSGQLKNARGDYVVAYALPQKQ
jgi:quinoprotein glucose dehydrogenase